MPKQKNYIITQSYFGLPLGHGGKAVFASAQETVCFLSSGVHLSTVPSVQGLVCFCVPGPQTPSTPEVATHFPSLVQEPSSFLISLISTECNIDYNDLLNEH